MGRPVAGIALILVLAAPFAAAQTLSDHQDDPADDVVGSLYQSEADLPQVDILALDGTLESGVLDATLVVAGAPQGIPANRSVDYMLLVDHQEGRGAFGFGDWDLQVRCTVTDGGLSPDDCVVTGNGTVLEASLDNATVHWRVIGFPYDRLEVGAGATQAANDGQSVVDGFDFTTNADPFAVYKDVEQDAPDDITPEKPWWQSGWILVLAAAVGAAFAYGRNRRKRT